MNADTIARALGAARKSGTWRRCRCPVHQSSGPTLALKDAPRGLAVRCHAGCDSNAVRDELARLGLLDTASNGYVGDPPDPAKIQQQREAELHDMRRRIAQAVYFWNNETVNPHGTVVERYWRSRGLSLSLPPTIRASRSWICHREGGSRPAMIALVEHVERGPVAVHRTFLAIDGSCKASFTAPRLSLGPIGGAAVRLADAGKMLVVAEGIETAASVMLATGFPTWAALYADGIKRLVLPPLPIASSVIIAADNDISGVGERAARIAAERWLAEGRRVRLALSPEPCSDFNDLLNAKEARHVTA